MIVFRYALVYVVIVVIKQNLIIIIRFLSIMNFKGFYYVYINIIRVNIF